MSSLLRRNWEHFLLWIELPLGRQIASLFLFLFLIWPIQIGIVSLAVYFHLRAGHPLGVIEEWIFRQSHFIMILSKGLGLFVALLFIFQNSHFKHPYKMVLFNYWGKWKGNIEDILAMAIISWALMYVSGGGLKSGVFVFQWEEFIISYIGTLFYYISDFFFLFSLNSRYQISQANKLKVGLFYVLLNFILAKFLFPFASGFGLRTTFFSLILLYYAYSKGESLVRPLFYIVLFLAPAAAIFGLDPMWDNQIAALVFKRSIGGGQAFIVLFLTLIHSWAVHKNLFQHRYLP